MWLKNFDFVITITEDIEEEKLKHIIIIDEAHVILENSFEFDKIQNILLFPIF